MRNTLKRLICVVCAIAMVIPFVLTSAATEVVTSVNRFNVVLLLDASGSMTRTDPNGYRYEALEQFMFMLADTGNYVGCVVFDTEIQVDREVAQISGREDKQDVVDDLRSFAPNHGDTNIGAALQRSVDMLEENGDPNLPSVIVFVSDGNTDLPTDEAMEASLEDKADAIERARNDGISVYTVCLNANGEADASEMEQISSATGGVFNEISDAEGLQQTLTAFYGLIYNTIPLEFEDEFGLDGLLIKQFEVPGLGVEEVNFLVYGSVSGVVVKNPSGVAYPAETQINEASAMVKVNNPDPGVITVELTGAPGTRVFGNMVYNVNLTINATTSLDSNGMTGSTEIPVEFYATLGTGSMMATSNEQYAGFAANVIIYDVYGTEVLDTIPMNLENARLIAQTTLAEGYYKYAICVCGPNLEKTTELLGPMSIVVPAPVTPVPTGANDTPVPTKLPTPIPNRAPEAVEETVTYEKTLWPWGDNSLEISLEGLAEDPEGADLRYFLDSSSFIEGKDYKFDDDDLTITMTHYSLSRGSFKIRAVDPAGQECDIKIVVKTVNVLAISGATLGIIIAIVVIALGISIWYWKGRPLRGKVTISYNGGAPTNVENRRGQINMRAFGIMAAQGFNPSKTYIQCTGGQYVLFKSNKKFMAGGRLTKKVKLMSSMSDTEVVFKDSNERIKIRFVAMRLNTPRTPGASPFANPNASAGKKAPSPYANPNAPVKPKKGFGMGSPRRVK